MDDNRLVAGASKQIGSLLGDCARAGWEPQLHLVAQFPGGRRVIRRVASARDEEGMKDALAELRAGVCLFGMGGRVVAEPSGQAGPDYEFTRGDLDILLEVSRIRSVYEEPPVAHSLADIPEILPAIGDVERDVRRIRQKIEAKFPQIEGAPQSILIIWNDQDCAFYGEAKTAVHQIAESARDGAIRIPAGLQLLVYSSPWLSVRRQQFYVYPVRADLDPRVAKWRAEWEMSTLGDLVDRALRTSVGRG